MRVDLTLKYLCLVKSRSIAKSLCEKQLVLIDGKTVRPATNVRVGERITIRFRKQTVQIELLDIPRKQLSKTAAVDYYQNLGITPGDAISGVDDDFDGGMEIDLDGLCDPE